MAGNDKAVLFKPDDITVELGGETHRLVFDLNAFCEIEKIYDSVEGVIQMLLGTPNAEVPVVQYKGSKIEPSEIMVGEVTLESYILSNMPKGAAAKHSDTLNLLYIGLLHDNTKYNEHEEIVGYNISKTRVGSLVNFRNLREVTSKIVLAILKDLLPPQEQEEVKNEEAPETPRLVVKNEA